MNSKQKWRFRLLRISFGLSNEYQEHIYEQFFFLKYHGGYSLFESYNLPIGLRNWFVERLKRQKDEENQHIEKSSR